MDILRGKRSGSKTSRKRVSRVLYLEITQSFRSLLWQGENILPFGKRFKGHEQAVNVSRACSMLITLRFRSLRRKLKPKGLKPVCFP